MEDIREKKVPYEYEGKTYELQCNFYVLADIVEEFGTIPELINMSAGRKMKTFPSLLAAMMNDYADSQGWPERVTGREVAMKINCSKIPTQLILDVTNLVVNALYTFEPKTEETDSDTTEESKN